MAPKTDKKCIYKKCMIPYDNKKYLFQLVFLILAFLVLTIDKKQLTITAIIMYIVPVLIDLMFCQSINKNCKIILNILTAYNILILIICMVGFAGAFVDEGEIFKVNIMYFSGTIKKTTCGLFLFIDLIVPFVFWLSSPCKKQTEAFNSFKQTLTHKS